MTKKNQTINAAKQYVKGLFANDFGGHGVDHTIRVYQNALEIAKSESACNMFVVCMAALLHDADDHKLFNTQNNQNARAFLADQGVSQNEIDMICEVINCISFSQNKGLTPQTLEGKIVQDADRLDAIGAIGIARTFAFGGQRKEPLSGSVQHFYDKLLLLKEQMNTQKAKQMAQHRHEVMLSFLAELENETAGQRE